jgi:carboxymethylenebutenolidase
MITYPANAHETPAYLARPGEDGSQAAVVVLQEWWGLVPHIKDVANRFAREGFIALAPDLYHGEKAEEPDEAQKLAMALDRERAVAEIVAAVHYLQQTEAVAPGKVGVVGWCMGGGLALSTAAASDLVGAAVAFYGRPLAEADTEHGVPHEVHIYPGAGHAFFNDTRPVYDAAAAGDAWQRTLAWFRRYLAPE